MTGSDSTKIAVLQTNVSACKEYLVAGRKLELAHRFISFVAKTRFSSNVCHNGWQAIHTIRLYRQILTNMATIVPARSESLLLHGTGTFRESSAWLAEVLVSLHTAYRSLGDQLMQMLDAFAGSPSGPASHPSLCFLNPLAFAPCILVSRTLTVTMNQAIIRTGRNIELAKSQ